MNLPMGRPGHWRVLPQLDVRGVGELRPGHTRLLPCAACAACEAAAVAPPPPPAQLPVAERPTFPVPGDRAVPPTLRPLAPVDLTPVRFEASPPPAPAPAAPRWTRQLALWELVLIALVDLGAGTHTEAAVVVAAWELDPERFGLRGHAQYPDSRTVVSRLSGLDGIVTRGFARRSPTGKLSASKDGRRYVAALRGGR